MIDLVPFTESDIDRVISWIPSVEALEIWTAYSFGFPLTREHLLQHIKDCAERGDRLIYKAIDSESGQVFGHIELGHLDTRNRFVRIGRVLIDPAVRGRGLGEAMVREAVAMAFEQHNAHRVELGVFDVNPRAIACYERVGFQREGMRRESFKTSAGGYWSEITMSILEEEWDAIRDRSLRSDRST
jgi:RimJ/RimL family protein N-acetyltransferase